MPGDSAFPSGTPSFQLLINYSHISHPILPSLLNMRDLFSSPNSAARGIVSELPSGTSAVDCWPLTPTLPGFVCGEGADLHLRRCGMSQRPVNQCVPGRFLVHPLSLLEQTEGPFVQPLPHHSSLPRSPAPPPLHLCFTYSPYSSQTMRIGLTGIETCSITLPPKHNQQISDK